jgi:AraC-like DNA-binding protein
MLARLLFLPRRTVIEPVRPFEDAIADLRITGCVLLHERYVAPWAIDVPDQEGLRFALGVKSGRVLPFHLARRGGFSLRTADGKNHAISAPNVVICVDGKPHRMLQGTVRKPTQLIDVLRGRARTNTAGSTESSVELICGAFVLRTSPLNPLLAALPPFVTLPVEGRDVPPLLAQAASMLVSAIEHHRGFSDFTTARIVEIFCAEAFRSHAASSQMTIGWFAALRDPRIAAALSAAHLRPDAQWTVGKLARVAALSSSRFAARFRQATGESAMSYITRWRMNRACHLLEEQEMSVGKIASSVGYESVSAFTRVFRSLLGMPPGQWRRRIGK